MQFLCYVWGCFIYNGVVVLLNKQVLIGDYEGQLHLLDRDTGKFVAREHPGGARISAPPIAADGRVFVIDDEGKLAAFRSGGGKAG